METSLGFVAAIGVIAAISILTIAAMTCVANMSTRLFEGREIIKNMDIENPPEKSIQFVCEDQASHQARRLIKGFAGWTRFLYFIAFIIPFAFVIYTFVPEIDRNTNFIKEANAGTKLCTQLEVEYDCYAAHKYIRWVVDFFLVVVLGYIGFTIRRVFRIAIPYYRSFDADNPKLPSS